MRMRLQACKHETDKIPFVTGVKWTKGQCAICWSWLNDPAYRIHYEKPKCKPKQALGLGDMIYYAIKWSGLAWLLGKTGCAEMGPCNKRRRWLNQLPGLIRDHMRSFMILKE